MIRIVDRYIAKETALTVGAVTGVLMLILLSNRFAVLLGDAAAGRLPRDTVFTLLGLASINYFIVVLPVALFLAVMLALGRLYRDSEMTTLMACGVGPASDLPSTHRHRPGDRRGPRSAWRCRSRPGRSA